MHPTSKGRETLCGVAERLRIAIETDADQGGKSAQKCLGMSSKAESRIDQDCSGAAERRCKKVERPFEQDRNVEMVAHGKGGVEVRPTGLIPIRGHLASGK
jgi:hypothetical protein